MHILGIKFRENHLLYLELARLYGIGISTSKQICNQLAIPLKLRVTGLTNEQIEELTKVLKGYTVEYDRKQKEKQHIQKLKEIKSYQSIKHGFYSS